MVQKAVLSDYDELLSFENRVFKVSFPIIMPKLYKDREKCADYHYTVKENGKIVGAIAAYPTEFITSTGKLKVFGIGSVAVDPKQRGKGIMRRMMEHCNEVFESEGADLAFLSGIRMRYERYGYIQSNNRYIYEFSDYYIKHMKPKESFSFISIKKCGKLLPDIIRLYNSQSCRWKRSDDEFKTVTATWHEKCYAIVDENGGLSGYLIAEINRKSISEIVLNDDQKLGDILLCYAGKKHCKELSVTLHEWQKQLRLELNKFGENVKIESHTAFKVFNFKNFIEVMMNEKLKTEKLCEGKLIMKIDGSTYCVKVESSSCKVELTDEKPELTLGYSQAVTALTTHYSALFDNALLKAWSPMCPISIPQVDEV